MEKKKIIVSSILSLMTVTSLLPTVNAANDIKLRSQLYRVDNENNIIARVEPNTSLEDFKLKFNIFDGENIKVYLDDTKETELTAESEGFVGTGMILQYTDANGETKDFLISVIGDFDGDGLMNQIELGNLIRHIVGIEDAQLTGIKLISADIDNNNLVDQRDISKIIRYISADILDADTPDIEGPTVSIEVESQNTDGITIKVVAEDDGRGMDTVPEYSFYIKKEDEETYTKVETTSDGTYKFEGLEADTNYNIKVVTEDKCGNIGEKIISYKTDAMPELNLSIEVNIDDKTATATVTNSDETKDLSNIVSYKYGIKVTGEDDSTYVETDEVATSQCIFSELVEGRNYTIKVTAKDASNNVTTKEASVLVGDNIPPVVTAEVTAKTSNSISIAAEATDIGGMPETPSYKYYIKGANDEEFVLKKQTTNSTYTFTNLTQDTEYVVKVETEDSSHNSASNTLTAKTEKVKDLNEDNVEFTFSSNELTNENVVVTVDTETEGYTIQTSQDGVNWENTPSQTFTENGTIYIRMVDENGQVGTVVTKTISLLDKLAPTGSMSLTNTTNSIRVVVTAADQEATNEYGKSGIKGYYYSKDGGETYTTLQTNNIYEFTNLYQSTDYEIKVKVEDNAGNVTVLSQSNQTQTIPMGTITVSSVVWNPTTHKASVAINTTATGYQLQYSSDSPNWTNINSGERTEEFEVGTTIYARLWDGYNESSDAYASLKITDNEKPADPTIQVTTGTIGEEDWYRSDVAVQIIPGADNQSGVKKVTYALSGATTLQETDIPSNGIVNITADGTTTINAYTYDNADNKSSKVTLTVKKDAGKPTILNTTSVTTSTITINATDTMSGIVGYTVTEDATEPTTFTECDNTQTLNVTVDSREENKDYYVWVKDEAGNISAYQKVTTLTIPTGTITINDIAWNANTDKASVTIRTTATGFTLQYSTDRVHWTNITSGNKTSEYPVNTTIYARLWDGHNESSDTYASLKITEADRP